MKRMNNQEVINAFVNGVNNIQSYNGNLYVSWDGNRLINYSTCIAQRNEDGTFTVNSTKYSVTTSKLQTYVRDTIGKGNYKEVTNIRVNTLYLK